jgi:two-component system sensor histidine kinase MprB
MARNLIDNAAAWSPEGGTVEVTLADGVLTVRDHGPGIAPEDLPKIFRRFYRAPAARDRPGSGLGLAIVQKAAAEHGWVVTAANASGGGAVFTVELRGARTAGVELFEQTA